MFELKSFLIGAGETTDSYNAWMVFIFFNGSQYRVLKSGEITIFWGILWKIKRFSDFTKVFAEYLCNFAILKHNVILFNKILVFWLVLQIY